MLLLELLMEGRDRGSVCLVDGTSLIEQTKDAYRPSKDEIDHLEVGVLGLSLLHWA